MGCHALLPAFVGSDCAVTRGRGRMGQGAGPKAGQGQRPGQERARGQGPEQDGENRGLGSAPPGKQSLG